MSRTTITTGLDLKMRWGSPRRRVRRAGRRRAHQRPPWWPASLLEGVIAVSAVIGAFTVIWNFALPIVETVWTTPKAEVSFMVPRLTCQRPNHEINSERPQCDGVSVGPSDRHGETGRQPWHYTPGSVAPIVFPDGRLDASAPLVATIQAPKLSSLQSEPLDCKLIVGVAVRTWRFGRPDKLPRARFQFGFGLYPLAGRTNCTQFHSAITESGVHPACCIRGPYLLNCAAW